MEEFTNGTYKTLSIKVNDNYLQVGCLIDNSFSENVNTIDTTVRTNVNGWTSSRPTTQSYSIAFSGLVTKTIASNEIITYQAIRDLKRQRTLIEWRISDDSGNNDYGKGYIVDLSDSASIDEFVSFSANITGFGEPSNTFDELYYGYKDRVLADGGTLEAEQCLKIFMEKLI